MYSIYIAIKFHITVEMRVKTLHLEKGQGCKAPKPNYLFIAKNYINIYTI